MFCGNVLDERMVSFLFSYEFEECFFNIYASTKVQRGPVFKKKQFLLFFKDERSENDAIKLMVN
jgi:hypothetical protein